MKKILFIFLMNFPFVVQADTDLDMRNQILDNQIITLTQKRDEKYEALQKCEKSTQGFKIAGLTTLVATGVGIYGNIKLAQKLQGNGNGRTGGSSALQEDKRSQEEKNNDGCEALCEANAAPSGCNC